MRHRDNYTDVKGIADKGMEGNRQKQLRFGDFLPSRVIVPGPAEHYYSHARAKVNETAGMRGVSTESEKVRHFAINGRMAFLKTRSVQGKDNAVLPPPP